jgi:hypothetical protein
VQLGAAAFGQRFVGHVADQEVAEPEPPGSGPGGITVGGAARSLGTDQLSADQHGEAWPHRWPRGLWRQRDDRLPVEHLADDACPLQDRPLLDVEPIQAGCQQRGHAGWDGDVGQVGGGLPSVVGADEQPPVNQFCDELFDK